MENYFPRTPRAIEQMVYIGISCAAVGGFYSFGYLLLVKNFARQMIIGTMFASVLLWFAFAGVFLYFGQLWSAIVFAVMGALNGLIYFWWRTRIPFATAMLKTVSGLIHDYQGTAYFAYVSLIFQFAWVFVWVLTVIKAQNITFIPGWLLFIFLILSFYWTAQVIKNVVHVTASGSFATWYFLQGTPAMPASPTLGAMKRSLTTSFGSICFGSLIVAALKTLRALVRSARNQRNGILVFLVECILGILDRLIQYFNLYAFTQVAIYGKSYCEAARDTWKLLKSHGIEAIINDNIISGVLTMGTLIGTILCGAVGGLLGFWQLHHYWGTCLLLGLLIGFVMSIVTMEVVESGVACIFVCFAMDPQALKRNDPFLYQKFHDTYGQWCSLLV